MSTNKKINIVVWGLGKHAINNIIPAISKCKNTNTYGFVSRDKNVVKKSSEKYECKSWGSSKEMLADQEIDVVFLTTPPGLHYKQGREILQSRKNLWCDKPLTTSLEHTKDLINLSVKNNLSLCEGFMYLHHPQYRRLKEILASKLLGEIKTIHCRLGAHWRKSSVDPGFRFKKNLGGSSLYDVGSYPLSLISDFLNDKDFTIRFSSVIKEKSDPVDMNGIAVLETEDNISCILEWANDRAYKNDIDIWGDNGSLHTEFIFSKKSEHQALITLTDLYGNKTTETLKASNHFELMIESFSGMLENPKKIANETDRILRVAKLLDRVEKESK